MLGNRMLKLPPSHLDLASWSGFSCWLCRLKNTAAQLCIDHLRARGIKGTKQASMRRADGPSRCHSVFLSALEIMS